MNPKKFMRLMSDYLDGILSGEEERKFERVLREEPEHRNICREFCNEVHGPLRSLPESEVPVGIWENIERKALSMEPEVKTYRQAYPIWNPASSPWPEWFTSSLIVSGYLFWVLFCFGAFSHPYPSFIDLIGEETLLLKDLDLLYWL